MTKRKVLFLRKKIEGQNSMEELAQSLKMAIPELEIVELPFYSTSLIGMIRNGLWARKNQGQVNHIFSITDGYLSLFLSGKKIITVHDLYFKHFSFINRMAIYLLWIILPSFFTKKYTCISGETRKHLLKIIPWVKHKTQIIYNPVSEEFFNSYHTTKNSTPEILHIGTAVHKNLIKVIEAIAPLHCKLIIVGVLFPKQKQLLDQFGIEYINEIDIPRDRLIKLYRTADIVSFPSSQEGFGMIIIEANAIGKPVVAGDIAVLREIAGEAAVFVNPKSTEEIRSAFERLIASPILRQKYIDQGRINSLRFSLNEIGKKYRCLYDN